MAVRESASKEEGTIEAPDTRFEAQLGADLVIDLRQADQPVVDLRGADATVRVIPVERAPGLLEAAAWQLALKRALDITASTIGLLLLSPLLLLVAMAVKVTSSGPVFYVHERIGYHGRSFKMLKFRSMYRDAHRSRDAHATMNVHAGPIFKIPDDPRITPVGRAIRRLSIDELPQLWNVLRGDMSLVGPRPPLPEECRHYGPRERRRLSVKPGITCIWQVSGRSDLDFDTWVDMDIEYIERWTLRRDLKLLVLTLPAVISGRGAY